MMALQPLALQEFLVVMLHAGREHRQRTLQTQPELTWADLTISF